MRTRILLVLLIVGSTAQASDWVSVAKSDNGAIEDFVDVSGILIAGEVRRAWVKVIYLHNKGYTMERDAFNCGEGTMRGEAFALYFADGTNQSQPADSFPDQWKPIPPDTIGSGIMQFICAWKLK
jgi:hypothetical protein